MTEARKQEILSVPVEFRRALTWPILGLLSPESTYGRSSIHVESTFSEAGLASILENEEDQVWASYIQAFRVAEPRSNATDWMDPVVRDLIERDGWAAFVGVADPARRTHRQLVLREHDKAKQFVLTLRVFREAVQSGRKGEALVELMSRAGKAAHNFHFDKAAFTALHLLSSVDGRRTRFVIEGDKVNAVFPNTA